MQHRRSEIFHHKRTGQPEFPDLFRSTFIKQVRAWYNVGLVQMEKGEYERAIVAFDRGLMFDPFSIVFLAGKAAAFNMLHRYNEALFLLRDLCDRDPRLPYLWFSRGYAYDYLGDYNAACEALDMLLMIVPGDSDALAYRGTLRMKQERPDEAILDYESCLRYSPDDRRILLLLASAQLNNGNPSAALEAVNCYFGLPDPDCHPQSDHRRRPAVCPDNSRAGRPYLECRFGRPEKGKAGAWAIKGMALLSLGRNSEALVCFASALMDDPLDTEVMRVMGGIFYSCSRYDEALQLCDRELALDPDNAVALLNRAITLGALGRHMEAAATCRKALDKIPDAVEGWKYLGALCTHLGRHDEACDAYRQALMVSPDDEDVKTNLAGAEKRSKEEE